MKCQNIFQHIYKLVKYVKIYEIKYYYLKKTWFSNLNLSRTSITQFSRLRVGHYLLPSHSYKLSLNDSPYCTKHSEEIICDLSHIIFSCPSLSSNRLTLFNFLKSQTIQLTLPSILNPNSEIAIILILSFIRKTGLSV